MNAPTANPLRYQDSGVNIDAGNDLARRIAGLAQKTHRAGVLGGIGGFGALFEVPARYQKPVLVSAADGVGTKLMLARGGDIGIDLVAMCVNDIIACGAEPLYFLDYFASGEIEPARVMRIIGGIARGCEIANCALAGGETAEMPGMYAPGEYDLAGFAVGIAEKEKLLSPARVRIGDAILGLASSGPHANGFSLIRKVLEQSGADLSMPFPVTAGAVTAGAACSETLGDALLAPTRIYARAMLRLFAEVRVSAVAHITGGGLPDNPPRVLPRGVAAEIDRASWPRPAVFDWLQQHGNIDDAEMLRTFNCGIGMLAVVPQRESARAAAILEDAGETVFAMGRIVAADGQPPRVVLA
ncbi:MAG: phosphoribosylformylglycinamidine cyclo-ligase [Gammaproteobacteria bacterium]